MTWLAKTADGTDGLERVFGLVPEAYSRFRELYEALDDASVLSPEILALCRLRIAMLLGCASDSTLAEMTAARVPPERAGALPRYASSPEFTDAERACIAYAEQYVLDPHGFTDADFATLRAHLSSEALAMLTLAVAVYDALARFRLALGIDDAVGARS